MISKGVPGLKASSEWYAASGWNQWQHCVWRGCEKM